MTKKSYPFRMDVTQTKVFSVVVEATNEAEAKYKAERLVAENGDTLKSSQSEELAEPAKFFPLGTYRCTKGLSHPNLGTMFTKGKVYRLEKYYKRLDSLFTGDAAISYNAVRITPTFAVPIVLGAPTRKKAAKGVADFVNKLAQACLATKKLKLSEIKERVRIDADTYQIIPSVVFLSEKEFIA